MKYSDAQNVNLCVTRFPLDYNWTETISKLIMDKKL